MTDRKHTGVMYAHTILRGGSIIGVEHGVDADHALDRYAEGSIYDRDELTARRGVAGCFSAALSPETK